MSTGEARRTTGSGPRTRRSEVDFDRMPGPKPLPLVGNLLDAAMSGAATEVEWIDDLHRVHGGILALTLGGQRQVFASSHELVAQMCSDPIWSKSVHATLEDIRAFAGDGLFTAYSEEPNWGKAHRLLMPAFGPIAIRDYFGSMLDIADQMLTRWSRFGPDARIDVADDMTRLTLDTIALCAFDYRFNSFYSAELHPFVGAMVRSLIEAGERAERVPGMQPFLLRTNRRYRSDIEYMRRITRDIVAARKAADPGRAPDDLLQRMLTAVDSVTGERLSVENIEYQLTTFLIAGHETTSGLLSFVTYQLLAHPEVLRRARDLVDEVLGERTPVFEDLARLGYLGQILRETLRLHPTAPAIALQPHVDTMLGGHAIAAGESVLIMLPTLHRDPAVWAEPDRFDPDRFGPDRMSAIPAHSWMPFGHGERACLGRPFALQEATLVLAMMLQRFEIAFADPHYRFELKETLTIKPKDLVITARPRRPYTSAAPVAAAAAPTSLEVPDADSDADASVDAVPRHGTPLLVLFGSNSGGSEGLARTIAADGARRGWSTTVAALDEYTAALPTRGPVVIVTASYNGTPPDNAARFVEWLSTQQPDLAGVDYLVLGCGSTDWSATYQRIPVLVDEAMARAGATRIRERGATDSRGDFFGDWERWYGPLWPLLAAEYDVQDAETDSDPRFRVAYADGEESDDQMSAAVVLENRELVRGPSGKSKRHIELRLPDGMVYRTGDYLSVLPHNHPSAISRLVDRLGIRPDTIVRIDTDHDGGRIPLDRALRVDDLLGRYVDLSAPATAGVVARLARTASCPPERTELERLATEAHAAEVLGRRITLTDLLEAFGSCDIDLAVVLELLPPQRVRQYSISSSSIEQGTAALTVSVLEAPAHSGRGTFHGTGSTYLQRAAAGTVVSVALAHPASAFRPPADNATPVVMIAAGSGMAPFRGFVRERMVRDAAGEAAGPTVLFFGCDHPEWDDLYADEYAPHVEAGRLEVHRAFSAAPGGDIRFVQHRLWAERARVLRLVDGGAHVYLCGDAQQVGPAVEDTLARMRADADGTDVASGREWLAGLRSAGRFAADVF